MQYCLTTPTLAVITRDGQKISAAIPFGATVTVSEADINCNRPVDVTLEKRTVMIFAQDIRERGELVQSARDLTVPMLPGLVALFVSG
jgi:hypothetical protein